MDQDPPRATPDEPDPDGGAPDATTGDDVPDADADDERLLARLRDLASALDPVPEQAVLAARSSLAYLRMDAELAALVHDSAEDPQPVAVRAETAARHLGFEAGEAQVELEVEAAGERRRLVGQCLPPATLRVTVRRPDGEHDLTTDDLGRFAVEVDPGPVSLRCTWPDDAHVVETAWVRV